MPKKLWLLRRKSDGVVRYLTRNMRVARNSAADIKCNNKHVSKLRHATFIVSGCRVSLKDTESVNGVYVNGKSVKERGLKEGDVVGIGTPENVKEKRLDNIFEVSSISTHIDLVDSEEEEEIKSDGATEDDRASVSSQTSNSSGDYSAFRPGWDKDLNSDLED